MLQRVSEVSLLALVLVVFTGQMGGPVERLADSHSPEAANERGLHYRSIAEPAKSMRAFHRAIALDPLAAEYHYNFAFMSINHPDAAMEEFGWTEQELFLRVIIASKSARLLEPENYNYAYFYASNLYNADAMHAQVDWEEIYQAWDYCLRLKQNKPPLYSSTMAIDTPPDLPVVLNLASLALEHGEYEEAKRLLDEVLAAMPHSSRANTLMAALEERVSAQVSDI